MTQRAPRVDAVVRLDSSQADHEEGLLQEGRRCPEKTLLSSKEGKADAHMVRGRREGLRVGT